jgi:glucarate dehydratase
MSVVPVAGHDSMLLNLSGAHGPFFTRNIVILKDNAGNTGVGEVPGGARIRQTLEDARPLAIGRSIGMYNNVLNEVRKQRPSGRHRLQARRVQSLIWHRQIARAPHEKNKIGG